MHVLRFNQAGMFLQEGLAEGATELPTILAIDLGTTTGYCYRVRRANGDWEQMPWYMGTWDLSTGRFDSGNLGFLRLRQFLLAVNPVAIFYEDVKYTPSEAVTRYNASKILARASTSSELIGALKHTVVTWAEDHRVFCTGIPIGTIKRVATGRGNANKEDMIRACNAKFSTNFDLDTYATTGADNVADAAFILQAGLEEYGLAVEDWLQGKKETVPYGN